MNALRGIVLVLCLNFRPAYAQTSKFEVASIKPCNADPAGGTRLGRITTSPLTFQAVCTPVRIMIQQAFLVYANGRFRDFNFYDVPIEGAPDWTQSERYNIEAKVSAPQSEERMKGPLLQALLEDRFGLKTHWRTQQVPVYELVLAKGGAKLKSFNGDCKPVDPRETPQASGGCRNFDRTSGPNVRRSWRAISVDDFIASILDKQFVGRPVVNKTGIKGLFDISLDFTPERTGDAQGEGTSIFTAIQEQLGLKLVGARGSERVLVIDRVTRPSSN